MELKTAHDRVAWLMENVPATQSNYILLLTLYWQVFDGIDIPQSIVNQLIEKGTEPETINRAKRKIVERSVSADNIIRSLREVVEDERNNQSQD